MLTLLWGLPALAALLVAALGRRAAWLGPALSGAAFLLALGLWPQAGSLSTSVPWFTGPYGLPISYSLGLSGLSLLLVALTLLVTALTTLAGLRQGPGFVAWLSMLGAAAAGMFLARDLVLFYVFWELMLVPAYFLLVGYGGPTRRQTAWKFLLYNIGGSLALLLAVAALVAFGAAFPGTGAAPSALPAGVVGPIALALLIAIAVKTPLFPLHGWVADTYADLPAPAAALVSGVQSKAGLYAMVAILLPLLPGGVSAFAPWVVAAGSVSVLYGAFLALSAQDARRLLAYSSISHLGLVAVAFVTMNATAIAGGIIQMVAHGLFSAGLFLFVGMLEDRLGGPVLLRQLGGIARQAPAIAGGLTLLSMAALGLPGLAGFPGELLMIVGIYHYSVWIAVLAGVGLVVAAAYMLRLIQLVLHGPTRALSAPDLRRPEKWLLAPLAVLLLVFGVYPNPIAQQATAAVAAAAATAAQGGSAQ